MSHAAIISARPDLQRAFDNLEGAFPPHLESIDEIVAAMRDHTERYGDVEPRPALEGVSVLDVDLGRIRAQWIVPDAPLTDGVLVHLHGGGWVAGSMHSHQAMAALLARRTRLPVLLPEYRLAPEEPFPAGLEDCAEAFQWAQENPPQGLPTPNKVHLVGDSCGGNLAASLVYKLVREGRRLPDKLVLISPVLDATENPDRQDRTTDPVGSNAGMLLVDALYTQGQVNPADPQISPVLMADQHLARFPPVLIQSGGGEFFYWDAQRFAYRLGFAGARVNLSVWPAVPHVWHLFVNLVPEATAACDEIATFLSSGT